MFEDKNVLIGIAFWLLVALFVVLRLKRRDELQKARLEGMRQVVDIMVLRGSYHYERADEPLPEGVIRALDFLDSALAQDTPRGKASRYVAGAGMLADAMGAAAARRGAQEALGRQ
jgi:hypothetical protein